MYIDDMRNDITVSVLVWYLMMRPKLEWDWPNLAVTPPDTQQRSSSGKASILQGVGFASAKQLHAAARRKRKSRLDTL